jgi:phage gp29-like protein
MPDELPPSPPPGEFAAVGPLDIGAVFANELRVPNDEIMRAKGGDLSVYETVLRDEQCYSTFKQLRTSIIAHEFTVEPGGDRPIDIEAADGLREQLKRIGWDAVSFKMLTAVWYGWAVGECMFGVDGSTITLDEIRVRKARRFKFDKDDGLRLIRTNSPEGTVMPPAKFWVFRAGADDDDDPYPLGLGHYCYWPVWFKRNIMRFWALWGEKFASPTPVIKYPPGAKEDERKKALALSRAIMAGGALAMPSSVALQLLEALARAGDDYEKFCKYSDAGTTKIILCQTMTTDSGSSLSQSQTHADVKVDVAKSYADLQCESFMRGPGKWLTRWNYPGAAIPILYRDYSEAEDLKLVAERDGLLSTVGYRPTPERVKTIYGDGYEPIPAATPTPSVAPAIPEALAPAFAESQPTVVGPADASVERLIGGMGWQKVIGPEVDAIVELCDGAKDLEEVRDRLGELAQRDPTALTEGLARVMFAANVTGQVGADVDTESD